MDEVTFNVIVGTVSFIAGYASCYLRKPEVAAAIPAEPVLVEVEGAVMSPRGGHKHSWTTQFNDGAGWRCGVMVEPGVICGWAKDGEPNAS